VGYVQDGYERNAVVFACMAARMLLFAEARIAYQELRSQPA
jgi:hypothetical protein